MIPDSFRIMTAKIGQKVMKTSVFRKRLFWVPVFNLFGHNAESVGNMDLKNIYQ